MSRKGKGFWKGQVYSNGERTLHILGAGNKRVSYTIPGKDHMTGKDIFRVRQSEIDRFDRFITDNGYILTQS